MKNLLIALLMTTFCGVQMQAQKIAVVDLNLVLESMPDYRKAQENLDNLAAEWRQQIANEYDKITSMYNKYQSEQVLMSDEMKRTKEEEIVNKEKEVRDMQKNRFGPEGDLFKKRQELVQPIQEKVYAAIQDYAKERAFDVILDKEASVGILFVTDALDRTDDVMKKLNIKK